MQFLICTGQGTIATKTWIGESCRSYQLGKHFSHVDYPVNGLSDLVEYLYDLPQNVFVIRGQVRENAPATIRRTYKQSDSWIDPAAQQWLCLDVDKADIPLDPREPQKAISSFVAKLPEGLREASCFWQLSSSAHRSDTLKAHVWFWLDRPYTDSDLKNALKKSPIDRSLFSPVQPHFVAAPAFLSPSGEPLPDPLPERCGVLVGMTDTGTVPSAGRERLREFGAQRLEDAERKISRAKDGNRHTVLNGAVYSLGQLCPHILSEAEVFQRTLGAALRAKVPEDEARNDVQRALRDGMAKPAMQGEDWKGELVLSKDYTPVACEANILTILTNDIRWDGVLGVNARNEGAMIVRTPPYDEEIAGRPAPRNFDNHEGVRLSKWLQSEYRMQVSSSLCRTCLDAAAEENRIDPVREWLDSLEWDGVPRCETFAAEYLGDDTALGQEALAAWLVSAVKRIYEPGCQADHMIVLEGSQGLGKSRFLIQLGGDYYKGLNAKPEDASRAAQELQGETWLACYDELAAVRKSDIEKLKAHITTRIDWVRLPYARQPDSYPRRCVFVATVNPNDPYLRDPTGARRFWPIVCTQIKDLDPATRAQIWAETRARYFAGETDWQLSAEAMALLDSRRDDRTEKDPWVEPIEEYLSTVKECRVYDVLRVACGMDKDALLPNHVHRVARVLRDKGWELRRTADARVWHAPPAHTLAPARSNILPFLRPTT